METFEWTCSYGWAYFDSFQSSAHSLVKCESLSPMQILESELDDAQQHLQLDDPSKIDSDSSEGKGLAIDEDAESNIIEQAQVNAI